MFENAKIATKINLSLLLVVFLPLVAVLGLMFFQVKRNTNTIVRQQLSRLAAEVSEEIDMTVHSAYRFIESIGDNPVLSAKPAEGEEARKKQLAEQLEELRNLVYALDMFEDLVLVNMEGELIVATAYSENLDQWEKAFFTWAGRDCFEQARAGRTCVLQEHARSANPGLLVIASAPVKGKDKAVRGVVGGRLKLKKVQDICERVTIGKTGKVFLLDADGLVLWHWDVQTHLRLLTPSALRLRILKDEHDTDTYTTLKGERRVCSWMLCNGYQDYAGLGWKVAVTQEFHDAFDLVDKMQAQVAAFSIGCFVFLFLLGGLLSRNIVNPIDSLVKATEGLAQGNLSSRAYVRNRDEIGHLANSFNKMADDLQQNINAREKAQQELQKAHDLLEVRVQERTAELAKANEQLKKEFAERLRTEEALRESERRRVMLESLGAATHHLGQPATILLGHLGMMKKEANNTDEKLKKHLDICVDAAKSVANILHKLHAVEEYKTTEYLSKEGSSEKDKIIEIE
ncbi:MAG: HAMP domain-containing protein [Kiritimatiellae bacterium]|nr:HAMP domain-containing protein [Kiritimatiellia bacterium]